MQIRYSELFQVPGFESVLPADREQVTKAWEHSLKPPCAEYKGLRNFKLIENIGKCVLGHSFDFHGLITAFRGAFSNVFRATDKTSGMKECASTYPSLFELIMY